MNAYLWASNKHAKAACDNTIEARSRIQADLDNLAADMQDLNN